MVSIPNPNIFTEETNQFRSLFPSHTIVRSCTKGNELHWFLKSVCAPVCPDCGKSTHRIHNSNERIIRDMDFGGRKLFLHTKLRRVRCSRGCRRQGLMGVACWFKQIGFLRWSLEKLPEDLLAA